MLKIDTNHLKKRLILTAMFANIDNYDQSVIWVEGEDGPKRDARYEQECFT